MIRHCVFIRYRSDVPGTEKRAINNGIASLRHSLPGFLSVESGANVSPEALDKGFHEGFIVTFTDAAARDNYLKDARHREIGERITAAAEGGPEGILVFDLEVL